MEIIDPSTVKSEGTANTPVHTAPRAHAINESPEQVPPHGKSPVGPSFAQLECNNVAFKPIPFNEKSPTLFFKLIEGQFALCQIKVPSTKYWHALSCLNAATNERVEDILDTINTDKDECYTSFKDQMIQRFSIPAEEKLRSLLSPKDVYGDQLPSDVLIHVKTLATACDVKADDGLKFLWLQKLSPWLQELLLPHVPVNDLKNLVKIADTVFRQKSSGMVNEIKNPQTGHSKSIESQLNKILQQVEQLNKRVTSIEKRGTGGFSNQTKGNNSQTAKSFERKGKNDKLRPDGLCFYHFKHKNNAFRCIPGCNYNSLNNTPSEN